MLGWPLPLNRSLAADLELLPGIGPARASAIIAERERAGPFDSLTALAQRVPGLGHASALRLRDHVFVGNADPCQGAGQGAR